jgi:HAE1 family hydrophobic/amphiphilic exporter-1
VLRGFERMFESWLRAYEWSLDRVLAYKSIMLGVTLFTVAGTIWLYIVVPKGFFPTEDTGFMIGITEAKTDIAFPAMVEHQRKVADIVRADKAVQYVNSTVGSGGPNSLANSGRMLVALKPRAERDGLREIIARLRRNANVVPGMQIFFQPIQNINLGGRLNKSQYQYTLQSNDTESLYRLAPEMRDKISKIPGLLDVTTDLYIKNPQVTVEVDREKAAVYGVTIDQVAPGRHNLYAGQRLSGNPGERARIPDRPERSRPYVSEDIERHLGAAVGGDPFRAHGRALAGQSPGPAAGGDDLVQSGARHLARSGGRCDPKAGAR